MANFCGKCGARLDSATGLCPRCDAAKLAAPSAQEPPLSKKAARKARRAEKKAAKKAAKKERWKRLTFGQKVRAFFGRLLVLALCLVLMLCAALGALVYFSGMDVPALIDDWRHADLPQAGSDSIRIAGEFTSIRVTDGDSAIEAAREAARNAGLETAAEELSVLSVNALDGVTYYRLQQNYNGIPVYGRTFVVSADDSGAVQSLTSNSLALAGVDTAQTIPEEEAGEIVRQYMEETTRASGDEIQLGDGYETVIYTFSEDGVPALAYEFQVRAAGSGYTVFLGVDSRTVLACYQADYTESVTGSGTDVNGNSVTFRAEKIADGAYTLEDLERNIHVYNADGKKLELKGAVIVDSQRNVYSVSGDNFVDTENRVVTVLDNGLQGHWDVVDASGNLQGENAYCLANLYGGKDKLEPVQSGSDMFADSKTVTAMKEAQKIYDFFRDVLGRTGFDGKNGSMSLVVNSRKEARSLDVARTAPYGILLFGKNDSLSTEIIGHEYMHSVEMSISGMLYDDESGAIMEAYSDVFGQILEDYNDGVLDGSCNWRLDTGKKFLGYNHDRNLADPHESGNPATVEEKAGFLIGKVIADEVHHNSTIISHTAYIMAAGEGDGTRLTMEELTWLWYRTLMTLSTNCTFSDFRANMLMTAENMGLEAEKLERIAYAFSAVGIGTDSYAGEYATDLQVSVFDRAGSRYGGYTLDVYGEKNLALWFTEPYSAHYEGTAEPLSLHLDPGEYVITVVDGYEPSNSYSKTITVRENTDSAQLRFATDFGMAYAEETTPENPAPADGAVELNGHRYYAYSLDTVTTWEEAKQFCESQGGYLATITSPEEDAFVYAYLRDNFAYESAYFGLTDQAEEGTWVWANGEVSSYTNWHSGEPNSENPDEDYAMYYFKYTDGSWNDGDFGGRTVNSGKVFICEWGEYSTAPQDPPAETGSAYDRYLDAAAKTTQAGAWSEKASLEADMSMDYGGTSVSARLTLNSDASIRNYRADDLSQIEISSTTDMEILGQKYAWTTEYSGGVARYQYTQPTQVSQELAIDPSFFNFTTISRDAVLQEEMTGNQLYFRIAGAQLGEAGIAAVNQISGVDNVNYGDVDMDVTLNDGGGIDTIVLSFDASIGYNGYNADVTYRLTYSFSA